MDEDRFNMSVRKFLKKVGVTAQREIEGAVRAGVASGAIPGDGKVAATATMTISGVEHSFTVTGDIELS